MYFYHYLDINERKKVFPKDASLVCFFNLYMEDRFFIYALCTKRDLSCPSISEVTADVYNEAIKFVTETYGQNAAVEIPAASEEEIAGAIRYSILKATFDNMTLGDFLHLN